MCARQQDRSEAKELLSQLAERENKRNPKVKCVSARLVEKLLWNETEGVAEVERSEWDLIC